MTTQPLTTAEQSQLDHLVRRAASRLNPDERGVLLRLWEQHRHNDRRAQRAINGLAARVRHLARQQPAHTPS